MSEGNGCNDYPVSDIPVQLQGKVQGGRYSETLVDDLRLITFVDFETSHPPCQTVLVCLPLPPLHNGATRGAPQW